MEMDLKPIEHLILNSMNIYSEIKTWGIDPISGTIYTGFENSSNFALAIYYIEIEKGE
tara:strand:+ start:2200 stop:2373 length:174 start_codon:yes stop_codon:yes gene_type:complete